MNEKAMFKLTYGLFIAGTKYEGKNYACIINTGIQVTSSPNRMSVTMMKTNNTTQSILKTGSLALSVLGENASLSTVSAFGMRKSSEVDKFVGLDYYEDINGNPYIKAGMIAYMSLKVAHTIDLGTHYMFICDVVDCDVLGEDKPMTYALYREKKSGGGKKWVCSVCHWVYDGQTPFEQLPESYKCPVCGAPKSAFAAE